MASNPCTFTRYGCEVNFPRKDIRMHEAKCKFKCYRCPVSICRWKGVFEEFAPHLYSHEEICEIKGHRVVFRATDINIPEALSWCMILSCSSDNFLITCQKLTVKNDVRFVISVQLCGSQEKAERFSYKLELNSKKKSLKWEATPKSMTEPSPAKDVDFTINAKVAKCFEVNGALEIDVKISKTSLNF